MFTKPLNTLGYYGKVHTHGDFVSKGLPRSFIEPWDVWLQEAILTSQRQLGDKWLSFYLTSPLYHFVLSPGICGDKAWLGILMPSVDKIGRYYPMTLGLMLDAKINPFNAIQNKACFAQLETLARSCVQDNYSLDKFNAGIEQLQQETFSDASHGDSSEQTILGHLPPAMLIPAWQQTLPAIEAINGLLPSLLDNLLKEQYFAYSLWWTEKGSEHVEPSFLFSKGLPPFDNMAALFDGNWQQWGWQHNRYPIT